MLYNNSRLCYINGMEKMRRHVGWLVLASEISHLFCCVLPTIAAVTSLAVGVGVLPAAFTVLHDVIHGYEIPIILFSGFLLVAGWIIYGMATRTDCKGMGHDEHQCHETYDRSKLFLIIGTVLFIANLAVFLVLHQGLDRLTHKHHDTASHHHETIH